MIMESLESLNNRIEYGRKVDNVPSKVFFSLEPTLRYALIDYLRRKYKKETHGQPLLYMADFELVRLFEELVQPDDNTHKQINELHRAVTDYRLITFARRHGNNSSIIAMKREKLKDMNHYLDVMEQLVGTLLHQVNSTTTKRNKRLVSTKAL